jgi:hypothetical protein
MTLDSGHLALMMFVGGLVIIGTHGGRGIWR